MKRAALQGISYYLPDKIVSNKHLAQEFPKWDISKVEKKVGISERRVAGPEQCASDLAVLAAEKLFAQGLCSPDEIDFVLLCTQSSDYRLPTTACLLQHRLGIPTSVGALDINLGCSGYIYGLSLAKGLIESGQASNLLFLTAETYSKFLHPGDKSVRILFGDAAAASIIRAIDTDSNSHLIGPFLFGTDGSGGANLIVPAGGCRQPLSEETALAITDDQGNTRSPEHLSMDGAEIFAFTLRVVPEVINDFLKKTSLAMDDFDLFVFHQANQYMLNHLRRRLKIPEDKFCLSFQYSGNTVSSTIPIALQDAIRKGRLKPGQRVMLVGFGVGYSWGVTMMEVTPRLLWMSSQD